MNRKQENDVTIQDEGYQPIRQKTVPNNNPHTNRAQSSARLSSCLNDGSRKSNAAVQHGLLMQYQAPVLIVKKPKFISGPFDIYDVPQLRMLKDNFRKDYHRQVQNKQTNLKFFNDLELDNYFTKKSNWLNSSKFQNTSSFYSAVNIYLPLIKNKSLNNLSEKYTSERNSRMSSSMRNSTNPSAEPSRLDSNSRINM